MLLTAKPLENFYRSTDLDTTTDTQKHFNKNLKRLHKRKQQGKPLVDKPTPTQKKKDLHQLRKIYVQLYGDAWKDWWVKHYWACVDTETMEARRICLCCLREGRW